MVMSRHVALFFAVAVTQVASLYFDASGAKEHPVSKVVELLTSMKADLEKEAETDEAIYEKLACWCETNDKGKTKAIADAEARLNELDATIQKKAALSASLKVEIAAEEKEIAANIKSLEVAAAMRAKAQGEFLGEEKEMIESIRALNQAVIVLSKQNGGSGKSASFLSNKVVVQAYATARVMMDRHYDLLTSVITPTERKVLTAFMQGPQDDYFDAKPTFSQAYAPQSSEIFGILRQMKETFEGDLSGSQKDEVAAQEAFADLKVSKEKEIQAGQDSVEAKKQQLADADQKLAQAKEDWEDTSASFSADKKFLMELKVKCGMTNKEWEERQRLRQNELEAVAKAIEILSTDEAREQFTKTFNPASFLQTGKEQTRSEAVAIISAVAKKNPKLAALAVSMRLDPFPKVKKAIDDMVAQLLKEKEDEITEKTFCVTELNKNTRTEAEKTHIQKRLENKIAALEQAIKEQTEAIDTLNAEMADLNKQREKASADRKAETEAFDQTVLDQKKTVDLLNKALKVLHEVYDNVDKSMLQENPEKYAVPIGGTAPKGLDEYSKSRASGGILAMIEQIITDANNMTKEAQVNEQNALDSFAKFVQTTNESLEAKDDAKTDLTQQKAQSEKDKTAAGVELKGTMTELEDLAKSTGDLHKQCDFMLANFETTQKARDDEVEALRGAKAFLNGMQKQK